jgi:hypothetical protein
MFFSKPKTPTHLEYDKAKEAVGMSVVYHEEGNGHAVVSVIGGQTPLVAAFDPTRIDEAHILYMQSSEILKNRADAGESAEQILGILKQLFDKYNA